ncbi:YdeI/OmpD-associated family protein [Amycolatopsis solani]|uniref:YdeI/OmpD-associated family protein n=1 Tax=Amycolatopsis solani TaxID=3028615 RepID=UPI0025B05A25|nr:YdeI/OmpD-associated family protein [Amycolatopsis sp. MEP2-6]
MPLTERCDDHATITAVHPQQFRAVIAAGPPAAFFDTLAQFYRKAYLRWIDATTRRPDLRAARIAEVVDLLAAHIKQRPHP